MELQPAGDCPWRHPAAWWWKVRSVHQGTTCPQQQFLFAWQRKSQGQLCIHTGRRTTHLAWFSLTIRRAPEAWGTATASPLASGNPSGLSVEKPLLERDGERMLLLCDGSRGLADVRDVQPFLQHLCLKPYCSPQNRNKPWPDSVWQSSTKGRDGPW